MSVSQTLSGHETELLKQAVPYAQQVWADENRVPTQEELRTLLKCRSVNAKNIQKYILAMDAGKVAVAQSKVAPAAEKRAVVQYGLGAEALSGTFQSHILRENAKLGKALSKAKFEKQVATTARETEVKAEIESLKESAKKSARVPTEIPRSKTLSGNMLEINIPDAHFGKMAWGVETGHENYDVKIAQATYMRAVSTLLQRTSNLKYDEIVYIVGNDLLNSNDAENKTAHGTIVTTDGRYHKTFWKVRSTIVQAVEEMRKIAPVRVILVYGNHDTLSAWHLGDSLECYFHNYKDVAVDNRPTYRKYYEFGKNMLMFTHGDKGKKDDYPLVMATEEKAMWGRTNFHECHVGHTHETKTVEHHGTRVRVLPALCPPDDWHSENAYVGNVRSAEAYKWNKTEGLFGIEIYNDNAFEPILTKREIV